VPAIQHSATFCPSAQDDYFTLHGANWGAGNFVSTPPLMSPQEQQPQPGGVYGDNAAYSSGATNPLDATSSPYLGTGEIGRGPSPGGNPSPPGGTAVYTPSTGSSPSGSSPPGSNPIAIAPASAPGYSVDIPYSGHITSADSIPERKPPALSRPIGRTGTTTKSRTPQGKMPPLFEDQVLGTKEIQNQQQQDLVYNDATGGWVRRAIMRSLSRKINTYKPISGEDHDGEKLKHTRAVKKDEDEACSEGYGN